MSRSAVGLTVAHRCLHRYIAWPMPKFEGSGQSSRKNSPDESEYKQNQLSDWRARLTATSQIQAR